MPVFGAGLLPKSVFGLELLDLVLAHFGELLGPPRLKVRLRFFVGRQTELLHDDLLDWVSAEGRVSCLGRVFPWVL